MKGSFFHIVIILPENSKFGGFLTLQFVTQIGWFVP
jgi:hypothetical protein